MTWVSDTLRGSLGLVYKMQDELQLSDTYATKNQGPFVHKINVHLKNCLSKAHRIFLWSTCRYVLLYDGPERHSIATRDLSQRLGRRRLMIKQKKYVTNRVLLKSRLRTNNSKSLTPTHRRSSSRFQCKHPIFRNTSQTASDLRMTHWGIRYGRRTLGSLVIDFYWRLFCGWASALVDTGTLKRWRR